MSLSVRGGKTNYAQGALISDEVRAFIANEDLLCVHLVLADQEDDAGDDAKEDQGADDTSDDSTCRRAGSDCPLLF